MQLCYIRYFLGSWKVRQVTSGVPCGGNNVLYLS